MFFHFIPYPECGALNDSVRGFFFFVGWGLFGVKSGAFVPVAGWFCEDHGRSTEPGRGQLANVDSQEGLRLDVLVGVY